MCLTKADGDTKKRMSRTVFPSRDDREGGISAKPWRFGHRKEERNYKSMFGDLGDWGVDRDAEEGEVVMARG